MSDFPTFNDLFRVGRDEILARNSSLRRDVIEREGTDANALVAATAAVGDEVIGQLALVESGLFLDSARGEQLDKLIFDRYGLRRQEASAARGSVDFTLPSPALATFEIPADTLLSTGDGRQFLVIAGASFPAGSAGPISVDVRSALAGADQQAAAGTITTILGSIPGAPSGLRVTNPLSTAGAANEEGDGSYIERARLFYTTVRRGTLSAIETAARNVPGIRTATAFEHIDAGGNPTGASVQLIVADAFAAGLVAQNISPPAYLAQSQAIAQEVEAALWDVRPAGIAVQVRLASVELIGVQLGLSFASGVAPNEVALNARSAIVTYVNGLAPGEGFVVSDALDALRTVPGLVVMGGEIISPPGDIVPAPVEVLRTTLALVVAHTRSE